MLGQLIYKKWVKTVLILLQASAAFGLAYCLLNIGFWMEDSYSLSEMAKSYEQSELFFWQVESVIDDKITSQQNAELFETDGSLDLERSVDIQTYAKVSSDGVQDMNTTYSLSDLIEFYENGGQAKLHEAIGKALVTQREDGRAAGEVLDQQSSELETILPVTGIPLSECSRWYSDPSDFVLSTYRSLDEVSRDVYERYQQYQTQDVSADVEAPSNLLYCIENFATGELYTNTGESSYAAAVSSAMKEDGFVSLYEGERSFNIMVTNPDHVLNKEAEEWFLSQRFVGTNERVYIAVDPSYPVSDVLQMYNGYFARREDYVRDALIGAAVCAVLLAASLILHVLGAGWEEGTCTLQLRGIDGIPTELAFGLYMIAAVLYLLIFHNTTERHAVLLARSRLLWAAAASSAYLVFLSAVLSLVRRIRMKTLWTNSICRLLVRTWKQVTSARAASGQLLFFYIIFFILNFLFLLLFGKVGIFLVFVLDMAVLLYLLRDMVGKQSIWEGIHRISEGNLQYKIDTSSLQGETYQMAKAVNEMGDGLQTAIDAIVKNERLKAELITNVSHDLKTPLTSIVNYVDLLKRENLQGERVQHYIEVLDQKSQRLKQLTEDLVEASKISSGNVELNMMRMPLQSMVRQAYGEFQERLMQRGLQAVWEMEREPAYIMADGRHLWRVLENLLGNIYKYALENTEIRICLHCEEDAAVLSIANTSKEKITVDAQELTGRFVRGDQSRSTEGSGLGLSIAQSLTQLQGGTLKLSVEDTVFTAQLRFPLAGGEE